MDATEFMFAIEKFGREKNIPLRDVLDTAHEIGRRSLQYEDKEKRRQFLKGQYLLYTMGFPEALPKGTRSIKDREEELDSD